MKKFTVISLLLVLVAGFVFAAGLTPYVASGYSVTGVRGFGDYSFDVDGNFTYGVANDLVDISADVEVDYVNSESEGTELDITSTLATAYTGDNLYVGVAAEYDVTRNAEDIFGILYDFPHGIEGVALTDVLTVDAKAQYAYNLKGKSDMLYVKVQDTLTLGKVDRMDINNKTAIGVNYYIPRTDMTTADLLAAINSVAGYKNYKFAAVGNASVGFDAYAGETISSLKKNASIKLDYNRFDANNNKLNFYAGLAYTAPEDVELSGGIDGLYTKKYGAGTYDSLKVAGSVSFTSDLDNDYSVGAKVTVDVPRLIPVELIENASYNLPATFVAAYEYNNGPADGDKPSTISVSATVHPVYVKFAKDYTVFDQKLTSFDFQIGVGTSTNFAALSEGLEYDPVFGAKATLTLEKGSFAVILNDGMYTGATAPAAGLTISYTKNYK